jgi:signal transduction histidine kinase
VTPLGARTLTGAATLVVGLDLVVGSYARASGASADPTWLWAQPVAGMFCLAVAWLLVRHDATSPVGPALAWVSASVSLVAVVEIVAASAYSEHPLPLADLVRPWWNSVWPLQLAGVFALLLVFPDGRRTGRGARWAPAVFVAACAGIAVGMFGSQRVGDELVGGVSSPLTATGSLLLALALGLAVVSMVSTYRRSSDRLRLQVRWLLACGLLVVALLFAGWLAQSLGASLALSYIPFLATAVVLVPTAVAVAVVRFDLFDVDRVLSASTSWFLTLALSAAVFGGVVVGISQVVHDFTGIGSAAAAFAAALVLLPSYRFINGFVGRFIDRDRHLGIAAVERFAAAVRAGTRRPEEIQEVLRRAQDDPALLVLLAHPDGGWVTLEDEPATAGSGFTLETGGAPIARVVLDWDSSRARRRIADLVSAAWVPIEMSRLRLGLRGALADAQASHNRLAHAAASERRHLERTLHDGAQQRLIATGMRLRLLQRRLPPDEAGEVDAAVAELQETVDELRRIANGIRPRRLDDGLEAALSDIRAVSPLPFELEVEPLSGIDDARALAAYLVVSEAVTNAFKHSGASRIKVHVGEQQGRLDVVVSDDGVGGVPEGSALTALRDRVLSVGGNLSIDSPSGRGTRIKALI